MANGNENIADVGSRIAAVILDHIIIAVIYAVLAFPLFGAVMAGRGIGAFFVPYIVVLWVIPILYFTFFEAYMKGQTPGKMAVKIKVVKVSGEPVDIGESLIRNILRIIDSIFVYLVGFIILSMSDQKQRLGDMAAGTIVVKA